MWNGIGGGITRAIKHYAEANNKYMNNFDPDKYSSFIMCYDFNSWYGYALSETTPYNGFQWVEDMPMFNEDFFQKLQ